MTLSHKSSSKGGFGLIEILVAVGIIVTVTTAAAGAWSLYFKVMTAGAASVQAALIVDETAEALNFLRDSGWTSYIGSKNLDTPYYLIRNGANYNISSSRQALRNGYVAEVTFTKVMRDAMGHIIVAGGPMDIRSRYAEIRISPVDDPARIIMDSKMLIHDFFNN